MGGILRRCGALSALAAAFLLLPSCAEESEGCQLDVDCPPGFICLSGVCWQDQHDGEPIGPGEEPQAQDDGGPGDDEPAPADDGPAEDDAPPAGDEGGGEEQPADTAPPWTILPGQSVGPVRVSLSLANPTTLAQVQAALGATGTLVPGATYTMSFLGDGLWIAGIDANGSRSFDGPDHVISVIAREGLHAQTPQGVRVGSTLADVRGTFGQPDHSATIEPSATSEGGRVDEYFRLGLFVNYDTGDVAKAVTVTRVYSAPAGSFDPAAGTLTYNGTTITLGDGTSTGDPQSRHRTAVGEPDWAGGFTSNIQGFDVNFYTDSYRIQGLEFIGVESVSGFGDRDKLVVVALYPFYYGQAADGTRIGSTKGELDARYGAPTPRTDPAWDGVVYLYAVGALTLGVLYTNDGTSASDTAVMLILNYQEG